MAKKASLNKSIAKHLKKDIKESKEMIHEDKEAASQHIKEAKGAKTGIKRDKALIKALKKKRK